MKTKQSPSPWRFEVELTDKALLIHYLQFRDLSVRELARRVGGEKYRSTIGHLRSGHTKSLNNKDLARAIEKELGCPPGLLFVPRVYRVSGNAA